MLLKLSATCALDGLEQSLRVRRVAQEVGSLGECVEVVLGHNHGVAAAGDDLNGRVVFVDLLDEPEQALSRFARGDGGHGCDPSAE